MLRKSTWKAWLDARTREAAERVCARISEKLELELLDLSIEPYPKGGHVASWTSPHDVIDVRAFIIEVIGRGQQIASRWTLLGSVHDELEASASLSGHSHISIAGITMLSWRASATDRSP
jgi:hypothetical protein